MIKSILEIRHWLLSVNISRLLKVLVLPLLMISGLSEEAIGQDALLYRVGNATICNGGSTTLAVNAGGGFGPYTVQYSDGTTTFTVNNYTSGDSGDQAITVYPTTTKTYHLVSVTFGGGSLPVDPATVVITVNPMPTAIVETINGGSSVCPNVAFTISATATNGSTYELWDQANTTKKGDMPYVATIAAATSYTVRAIGISPTYCTLTKAVTVGIDNVKPTITTCPPNQNLNTNSGSCNATIPV